jgi:hypothetical protein
MLARKKIRAFANAGARRVRRVFIRCYASGLPLSTAASILFFAGIASAALPCSTVSIYATAML